MRPFTPLALSVLLGLTAPGAPAATFTTDACAARGRALEATYARVIGKSRETGLQAAAVSLSKLLARGVALRKIPGGVIEFGGPDESLWVGQGFLSVQPSAPVRDTTLYDIASLSKVVGTATSIHLLSDRGAIDLSAPLENYLPELKGSGPAPSLGKVPLERLLRHRGGTQDLALRSMRGPDETRADYFARLPRQGFSPELFRREVFHYTDAAYILLGAVVERVSGLPLDRFVQENVFVPLGMNHSLYRPAPDSACAPTARASAPCAPHDPMARAFGGVSGNAGIFSTATDLGIFARMVLNGGRFVDSSGSWHTFLSPESIVKMTTDEQSRTARRGEGFDIGSPYACAPRGPFPLGSFGHTGYTGTSLWIDPAAGRFVVLLTNEVLTGKGPIDAIRWNAAKVVSRYFVPAF